MSSSVVLQGDTVLHYVHFQGIGSLDKYNVFFLSKWSNVQECLRDYIDNKTNKKCIMILHKFIDKDRTCCMT